LTFLILRLSLHAPTPTLLHSAQTIKSIEHQFLNSLALNKADVAQLVEQPIRNRQVTGSSPVVGSKSL
jgi:hypothetical protein